MNARTCGPLWPLWNPVAVDAARAGGCAWRGSTGYGMLPALRETRTKADSRACGRAWAHLVRPAGAGPRRHYRRTHYRCGALAVAQEFSRLSQPFGVLSMDRPERRAPPA